MPSFDTSIPYINPLTAFDQSQAASNANIAARTTNAAAQQDLTDRATLRAQAPGFASNDPDQIAQAAGTALSIPGVGGATAAAGLAGMHADQRAALGNTLAVTGALSGAVLAAPPEQRAALWSQFQPTMVQAGAVRTPPIYPGDDVANAHRVAALNIQQQLAVLGQSQVPTGSGRTLLSSPPGQKVGPGGVMEGQPTTAPGVYQPGQSYTPANLPAGVSPDEDAATVTMMKEASNQGDQQAVDKNQQSVASVIQNRANGANVSPSQVVTSPQQFSVWNTPESRADLAAIDRTSPQYQRALANFRAVNSGAVTDATGGADHYYAPAGMPNGASADWAVGRTPTAVIGGQKFYKLGYRPASTDPAPTVSLPPHWQVPNSSAAPPAGDSPSLKPPALPPEVGPPGGATMDEPTATAAPPPPMQPVTEPSDPSANALPPLAPNWNPAASAAQNPDVSGPAIPNQNSLLAVGAPPSAVSAPAEPVASTAPGLAAVSPVVPAAAAPTAPAMPLVPNQNALLPAAAAGAGAPVRQNQLMPAASAAPPAAAGSATPPVSALSPAPLYPGWEPGELPMSLLSSPYTFLPAAKEGYIQTRLANGMPNARPSPGIPPTLTIKDSGNQRQFYNPAGDLVRTETIPGSGRETLVALGNGSHQMEKDGNLIGPVFPPDNRDLAVSFAKNDNDQIPALSQQALDQEQTIQKTLEARQAAAGLPTGANFDARAATGNWLKTYMPAAAKAIGVGADGNYLPDPGKAAEASKLLMGQAQQAEKAMGGSGGLGITKMFVDNNPNPNMQGEAIRDMSNLSAVTSVANKDYIQGKIYHITTATRALTAPGGGVNYSPAANFDKAWFSNANALTYFGAVNAMNGKPYDVWSKGLSDADKSRALGVVARIDPMSTVVGRNGLPLAVSKFSPADPANPSGVVAQ